MIQLVKGTKDIYGAEVKAWQEIEGKMRRICETFGIGEMRTPMFEFTELFARGVGETTDIVQKEMYTFTDDGDRSLKTIFNTPELRKPVPHPRRNRRSR